MSMYETVARQRLYETVAQRIRERILGGDLKPGDQLPAERELAEGFGVSRIVVREAIKTLVQSGLVEVQTGRGTFVIDGASRAVYRSVSAVVRMQSSRSALANLVQVRAVLEPGVAALAALHATDDDIDKMRVAVEVMDSALYDPPTYIRADLDFHLAVADATGNTLLAVILDPVVDLLFEQRERLFDVEGAPARGQEYHWRILEAVREHDPEAAELAMRAHIAQVRSDIETAVNMSQVTSD